MKDEENYLEINRKNWNLRTETHFDSEFYNVDGFLKGASSLNPPELKLLGEVQGKSVLHLQCHFGLDTLSIERLGASCTGVDIADKAIEKAQELATKTGSSAQFVCSDLYSLKENLEGKFDIVFTSYGTVGWLPDINKWAGVVEHYLKPGGVFIMVDFHPVLWMLDDDTMSKVSYRYFTSEAIVEEEQGSYANRDSDETVKSVWWNHGLSEIMGSLLNRGLRLQHFQEYDYSCYDCFPNLVKEGNGVYRPKSVGAMLPMMYSIVFQKP